MTVSTTIPKQTSALHEILNWSVNRPEWQRDALRRIVEKGNLDSTDIVELERICRSEFQIDAIKLEHMAADPFRAAHWTTA